LIFPPDLLDALQALEAVPWEGLVYRHMLADYPPERSNTRGARWNPPEVAAIYTSLARATALAEAEYRFSLEPFRPRAKRTLYTIRVKLAAVLDLSRHDLLEKTGIKRPDLEGPDFLACQTVGGAVNWLGYDGLLVPSARSSGNNLVLYELNRAAEAVFSVVDAEVLNT
jgi:RES domain-containing protein